MIPKIESVNYEDHNFIFVIKGQIGTILNYNFYKLNNEIIETIAQGAISLNNSAFFNLSR